MGSLYPEPRDRPTRAPDTPIERGRRSADRRPGSGVAGARGRVGLPGSRVRRGGRGRRRPRRQHQPDRLPGGLHRPLVRRPGRGHDLSAHRQLRPPRRRRPVDPPVAPRARRRQRHGGRSRRCAPAGHAAARCIDIPAIAGVDTRALARHLRANGCLRGDRHRTGRDRSRRGGRGGSGRATLGGPGLRRPGLAVVDHGHRSCGGRRPADRDRRLRIEVEHRPRHAPSRRPGPHPAAHDLVRGRPRSGHRRPDPVAGPGGSGSTRRPRRPGEGDHRRRQAAARHLPRSPDRRPGCGRGHDPAPVRTPRGEPSGPRRGAGRGPGDGPEPRGPGRRRRRCRVRRGSGSARSTSTTARSRACATARSRSRRSSTTPRARRGRSTRWRSSTGSWLR